MNLEHELKHALRREEPPEEFSEYVMTRVESVTAGRRRSLPGSGRAVWRDWFRVPAIRWASASAFSAVLAIGSLAQYRAHERRRRQQGEMARAKVMLALRIASAKFNGALREVKQVDQAPRLSPTTKM